MRFILILTVALLVGLVTEDGAAQDAADIVKGAQVWAANCARCHNARSPLERSDREWYTVMQHMRARANLTRNEALTVTVYLQASNGIESAGVERQTTPAAGADVRPSQVHAEDAAAEKSDSLKHPIEPKQLNRLRNFLRDQEQH